jgi:hypothetical protein
MMFSISGRLGGQVMRQMSTNRHSKTIGAATAMLLTFGTLGYVPVRAADIIARFEGGIGVIPASSGAGAANADGTLPNVKLNIVRGINPGAGPWRIADLRAEVDAAGHIRVRGRGLLLASGNSIGQNANQSVFATLFCEATAPFVERNTSFSVPLEPNGDFRIDDVLNPAPTECASPVLLIRNAAQGVWFAAGIPSLGNE